MTRQAMTRREWLVTMAGAAAALGAAAPGEAQPAVAPLPHLDEKDKLAVAFAYVADAAKVDPVKSPNYKVGQKCSNCSQLTGKDGETWRPCKIFTGKTVHTAGWCKVWLKKV